jgi:hypothetical protein
LGSGCDGWATPILKYLRDGGTNPETAFAAQKKRMKANNAKILIPGAAMAGLLPADSIPVRHDCKGKNPCNG